jgi:hypothetical protein
MYQFIVNCSRASQSGTYMYHATNIHSTINDHTVICQIQVLNQILLTNKTDENFMKFVTGCVQLNQIPVNYISRT